MILVDTSGLYAVLDADDRFHRQAAETWHALLQDDDEVLITHDYVLLEAAALAQRRLGVEAVSALRDAILPVLSVTWVDEALHREALGAVVAARDRYVSLVDRVSFEVMRRRGADRVFGFDGHFAEAGFHLVPGG